jgi:indole-3-glycerol phosphate synthase
MTDILSKIAAYKRDEVAKALAARPLEAVEAAARKAPPVRPLAAALEAKTAARQFALIGEVKKASPSKGLIRADFDPASLATAYEKGGAACLSILTDGPSFQGAPEYLTTARAATQLPVLRKDFMLDRYQVAEARAMGADCILIIMAMVDDVLAGTLAAYAKAWHMDAIAEVHDKDELDRALKLDCRLIGINNRDLKTFETNIEVTERLAPRVPHDRIVIAESGIAANADLQRLAKCGVHAFLVGESLMRQPDVTAATRALLSPGPAQ